MSWRPSFLLSKWATFCSESGCPRPLAFNIAGHQSQACSRLVTGNNSNHSEAAKLPGLQETLQESSLFRDVLGPLPVACPVTKPFQTGNSAWAIRYI